VTDVIRVIEGVVSAQYHSICMPTVMLNSSMHSTAELSTQTWCTWLRYLTLLMVCHGNLGVGAGWAKVRKSGNINQKVVKRSTWCKLPAESTGMWYGHVMHHSDSVDSGWADIVRPQSFWMQLTIHRNPILVVNDNSTICCIQLLRVRWLYGSVWCKH